MQAKYSVDVPSDVTLPEFVLAECKRFGSRTALIDDATGESYTFEQFNDLVWCCARGLRRLGLGPGDRLCIVLPNCIQYPVIFLGIQLTGSIAVTLSPASTRHELEFYLKDTEATFVVVHPSKASLVDQLRLQPGATRPKLIVVGDLTQHTTFRSVIELGREPLKEVDDRGARGAWFDPSPTSRGGRTVASIAYSSGTTGMPKGCQQSHYSYLASTLHVSHWSVSAMRPGEETMVSVLPMFHMFGHLIYLTYALTAGCTQVVVDRFHVDHYLGLVQKYRATLLYLVPPAVVALANSSRLEESLASVSRIVTSAAPLLESTAQQLTRRLPHTKLSHAFGMTECLLFFLAPSNEWKPLSSGKLLPNCAAKIVDAETERSVRPLERGELRLKGPTLMNGYWRNPSATVAAFDDEGWFRTGDIAFFDEEGNVFVVGRLKEILRYKGNQIAPAELESLLVAHQAVLDAAVIGMPDEVAGDLPRAYVVLKPGHPATGATRQQLFDFVHAQVSPYKRLRGGIVFIDQIPKLASGKILKKQLEQLARSEGAVDPSSQSVVSAKL